MTITIQKLALLLFGVTLLSLPADQDLWEAKGPHVRIKRNNEDGSYVEFKRDPEDRTLIKISRDANKRIVMTTTYYRNKKGFLTSARVRDGHGVLIFRVKYGYHKHTGQLIAEDMFDARVKRYFTKLDQNGQRKESPVRRIYYFYDENGEQSKAISLVLKKGKHAAEHFKTKTTTTPRRNTTPTTPPAPTRIPLTKKRKRRRKNDPRATALPPRHCRPPQWQRPPSFPLEKKKPSRRPRGNCQTRPRKRRTHQAARPPQRRSHRPPQHRPQRPLPHPQPLLDWLEKDLGLPPSPIPPLAKLSTVEERRAAIESNLDLAFTAKGLAHQQRTYELLGLYPPNAPIRGQWIALGIQGEPGIYDLAQDTVLLPDDFDQNDPVEQAALIKLLTTQRLARLRQEKKWPNTDAFRAWLGTIQGVSTDVKNRYLRHRSVTADTTRNGPAAARESLLIGYSPTFQGLANFSRMEGAALANTRYVESRRAFHQLLQNPPNTTYNVIFPNEPSFPIDTPDLPATPGTLLHQDSLGALPLLSLLDPHLGIDTSNHFTSLWRGDQYRLYSHDNGEHLLLHINFDKKETARKIATQLSPHLKAFLNQRIPTHQLEVTSQDHTLIIHITPG